MVFNILKERIAIFINYCLLIFEVINFLRLEISYWIASRDTEMILKILISQFSATFH